MHIEKLLGYTRQLSNSGWCRWWAHFNYPQNPAQMAIQVLDRKPAGFEPVPVPDLEKLGFRLAPRELGARFVYVIDRTNEDGTPYESKL